MPLLRVISASPLTRMTLASFLSQEQMAVEMFADEVIALRSLVKPEVPPLDLVLLDDDVVRNRG